MKEKWQNIRYHLIDKPVSLAPLAVFRIFFGAVMVASMIRFVLKGWVHDLYIKPDFHFSYYGFEWVQPLNPFGMYGLFALAALAAFMVMIGLYYRMAILTFFLAFTYIELIDKTYYLNHYYFISLVSLLMCFLPAHRYFSLDVLRKPALKLREAPAWTVNLIIFQLGLVYFYAGVAKLNYDWLFRAMPMQSWLAAKSHWPLVGDLMNKLWVAYAASWFGALYDLSVAFLLLMRKTRWLAYGLVIFFHGMTALMFQIGMFPYIMIGATLIFFPASLHHRIIGGIQGLWRKIGGKAGELALPHFSKPLFSNHLVRRLSTAFLITFVAFQLLWPLRHLLYPGNVFWHEKGYRYSWRVMLMEKEGTAFFHIQDPETGHQMEIDNDRFLTGFQEKMMATQPDMILQYAHHLSDHFKEKGINNPIITAECYVTLNGRGSRLFIDFSKNLAQASPGFHQKDWVLPFEANQNVSSIKASGGSL